MQAEKFLAAQGPLKERYRTDAEAALLTLKAKGTADDSTVACKVETGRGLALAGIHPKCGGSGLDLCSGDLLLEALVACAGVSLKAAATVLNIPVKSAVVSVEGDVDLRGTLGVAEDVPVGLSNVLILMNVKAWFTSRRIAVPATVRRLLPQSGCPAQTMACVQVSATRSRRAIGRRPVRCKPALRP
jgi:uncharacterized OsmC-like protein